MRRPQRKTIVFKDHPEFTPNVSPKEMFEAGIFGGAYFRPIHSGVTGEDYADVYVGYKVLRSVDPGLIALKDFNYGLNKYGVKAGSSLEEWEAKGWIVAQDPYGWVQWYCLFFAGRRTADDARQIDRWNHFAGPKSGRFRTNLINKIKAKGGDINDYSISPVIRQGLLQWGYELTQADYDAK